MWVKTAMQTPGNRKNTKDNWSLSHRLRQKIDSPFDTWAVRPCFSVGLRPDLFGCLGLLLIEFIRVNIMDHCLAPSNETGRSGTDNLTMIVVVLIRNMMTKEEWYDLISKRVADGDGPCTPPKYGKPKCCLKLIVKV